MALGSSCMILNVLTFLILRFLVGKMMTLILSLWQVVLWVK